MYFEQVLPAAYKEMLNRSLPLGDHAYNPDTQQLVLWRKGKTDYELDKYIRTVAIYAEDNMDYSKLKPYDPERMRNASAQFDREFNQTVANVIESAQADTLDNTLDDDFIIPATTPLPTLAPKDSDNAADEYTKVCDLWHQLGTVAVEDFLLTQPADYAIKHLSVSKGKAKLLGSHAALCKYAASRIEYMLSQGTAMMRLVNKG